MPDILAKGVRWDLSDLYASIDDPIIKKDTAEVEKMVREFTNTYKGTIVDASPASLHSAISKSEKIWEKVSLINCYASYLHSIDTQDPKIGKFYQEAHELENNTDAALRWLEIELLAIADDAFSALVRDKLLAQYATYLANVRKYKPHTLTEAEEIVFSKKEQTGRRSLIRLFDEVDGANTYELVINGIPQTLNYSALTPYLTVDPDREIRIAAASALTRGLKNKEKLYVFTMNNLLNDKKISDEIRHYSYPQQSAFLHYGIKKDTVTTMVKAIEKGYPIAERYYGIKKDLLGFSSLHEYDRYSYLHQASTDTYTFEDARDIVLSSYKSFSPLFSDIAEKFFKHKWIDAEIQPYKRAGAYCSYSTPALHPYILVNYAGQIRDVTTLAHELGHGVHGFLSGQNNTLLQAWPSTVIAEVASIFAEMIVFDNILATITDKSVRSNLLAEQLQSIFASVFRQNAFFLFESDIHAHRREKGELATEDFNGYFQNRLQAMFGRTLTLTSDHAYWWMPILHFYRYNFYVFSYSFGQMLSLALYARYKEEGDRIVSDYIEALSLGGSKDPYEITRMMGVNINDPDFWKRGLDYVDMLVTEFATLSK